MATLTSRFHSSRKLFSDLLKHDSVVDSIQYLRKLERSDKERTNRWCQLRVVEADEQAPVSFINFNDFSRPENLVFAFSLFVKVVRKPLIIVEMMPDGTVLRDSKVSGIPLRAWFDALNERIRQHVGRDARNLQIGHSYLLQSGSPIKEIASLKRAIRDDIIPL